MKNFCSSQDADNKIFTDWENTFNKGLMDNEKKSLLKIIFFFKESRQLNSKWPMSNLNVRRETRKLTEERK